MNHKGTEGTKKRERKSIPIISSYPVKTSVLRSVNRGKKKCYLMERENEPQRHREHKEKREKVNRNN
jgi:hypothetical protein